MEEGGKISQNNSCEDHLATSKHPLDTKVKNNDQWLVCGFNGFGQFKFGNRRKLQQFKEFQTPFANVNNGKTLVACSWNCLAIANGSLLLLQGFISADSKTVKLIETKILKSIDLCDKYCLVLLENGKVYKLLPEGNDLKEVTFQTNPSNPPMPQKRNIFGDYKCSQSILEIDHIACGNNITIAVSKTGAVFNGTTQIYQFSNHERIKQLKCGIEHALLLTVNGDLYSLGNGLRGQLGLEVLRVEEVPTLIDALAGVKITYIAAGGWHSAAISAFGDLYTWGFNSNGQLGLRLFKMSTQKLKEPTVYHLPQLLDLPTCQCENTDDAFSQTCYPLKVVAGGRHTILQMSCGAIYASGWNSYGQLGLREPQEYCDSFQCILQLNKSVANDIQIVCGDWCTLIKK